MKAPYATKSVKHLKNNNGSWAYRRRVPKKHQKTLGEEYWNRPCGNVSYQKAVAMVTEWAEEDDALIASLDHPDTAANVREATEAKSMAPKVAGMIMAQEARILPDDFDPLDAAVARLKAADQNPEFDKQDQLARYRAILEASFSSHIIVPTDPDKRLEFDMVKTKLERRISEIAGDPNTITAVAERYYNENESRTGVRRKYRGNIKKLTDFMGDLPISHVTSVSLRRFRDQQSAIMMPSSLSSVFTPIRGMFKYAIDEELIENNPVPSVVLKRDKRSVHERKCIPYPPLEMKRLLEAMEEHWGSPKRGLRDERRIAIHMVCRVMAFSCLRPIEVVRLESKDVTDEWIKVRESKTPSSHRTVPLHPALADFPAFMASGGLETFRTLKTDQVEPVRYNFRRLIRDFMDPPISEPKKVLYSLRSTFSNAMRRAGANPDIRRAILGHAEGGSLNHYDDGPEFFKKRKWVNATDPTVIYPDTDDYYDDGLADDE
ncbi:tyrosine-type recombinase/integrase [Parasulfitobacter algicola]|uniref:Phage integrase SAM-like domain-containing protein n=1 Tax=Parasulfitobacter algicola TaxID=2614809 RepID=A0ABX2IUH6_9RHOB|nr:phage integrase SAM-like domain-containing protein [Sulfitobacter algicola]NSX56553.1 phage integrase SAM-like domain-containing protein [Sulfitobacter algicola]